MHRAVQRLEASWDETTCWKTFTASDQKTENTRTRLVGCWQVLWRVPTYLRTKSSRLLSVGRLTDFALGLCETEGYAGLLTFRK